MKRKKINRKSIKNDFRVIESYSKILKKLSGSRLPSKKEIKRFATYLKKKH